MISDLQSIMGSSGYELALDWPQNFEISEQRLSEIRETSLQNKLKLVIHTAYYYQSQCQFLKSRML